jgi:hypothetical protein
MGGAEIFLLVSIIIFVSLLSYVIYVITKDANAVRPPISVDPNPRDLNRPTNIIKNRIKL